jgi:hypothetical protein
MYPTPTGSVSLSYCPGLGFFAGFPAVNGDEPSGTSPIPRMPARLAVAWQNDRRGAALSEPRREEDAVANPLQAHYVEWLWERIRSDQYPSATHMNLLESVASPEVLVAYILFLMEKIENEPYPNVDLMKRVQRLIAQFGS